MLPKGAILNDVRKIFGISYPPSLLVTVQLTQLISTVPSPNYGCHISTAPSGQFKWAQQTKKNLGVALILNRSHLFPIIFLR